jgi:hypothetical protein
VTLLDLLNKAAGSAAGLVALLERVRLNYPDLASTAEEWLLNLSSAVSQKNLVALAAALPAEIANIATGKLDPKDHPSDAI